MGTHHYASPLAAALSSHIRRQLHIAICRSALRHTHRWNKLWTTTRHTKSDLRFWHKKLLSHSLATTVVTFQQRPKEGLRVFAKHQYQEQDRSLSISSKSIHRLHPPSRDSPSRSDSKAPTTRRMRFLCAAVGLLVAGSGTLAISSSSSSSSSSLPSPPTDIPTAGTSRPNHHLFPWTTQLLGGATDAHILLGKDEEATESLEISIPLSQSTTLSKNDAPLMRDIQMLTEILSDLVEKEDPRVHELCEEFLEYGKQRYVNCLKSDRKSPRSTRTSEKTMLIHFLFHLCFCCQCHATTGDVMMNDEILPNPPRTELPTRTTKCHFGR
jgi:hypothetical protein